MEIIDFLVILCLLQVWIHVLVGYYGDEEKECKCTPQEIHRYLNKISGPLLDRIDIQIEVKRPKIEKISSNEKLETSAKIRERVNKARKIQLERYKKYGIYSNAELNTKLIAEFCRLDEKGEELLQSAFRKLRLSVRAYERILKVARTIADLENKTNIEFKHVAEAIQYRSLDKFIKWKDVENANSRICEWFVSWKVKEYRKSTIKIICTR